MTKKTVKIKIIFYINKKLKSKIALYSQIKKNFKKKNYQDTDRSCGKNYAKGHKTSLHDLSWLKPYSMVYDTWQSACLKPFWNFLKDTDRLSLFQAHTWKQS